MTNKNTVYFSTKEEADKFFDSLCYAQNAEANAPYSARLFDPNAGEEFDGWAIDLFVTK